MMLGYRHGFHAANAADVHKHSVLVFCLEYLLCKDKPLLCVDTHAGAGLYKLNEGYASRNREWENGIARLTAAEAGGLSLPPMLRRYMECCLSGNGGALDLYAGSPVLMSLLLRPEDRLVCFELHPGDFPACEAAIEGRGEVRQRDGFTGLKSLLPPPGRRGLVFIDPSYEVKTDYPRAEETLAMALKRFATGTYIVWYPLLGKPPPEANDFPRRLFDLYDGNRCRAELYTARPKSGGDTSRSPREMYGSGLVIYNPPWTLAAALAETLPVLAALTGAGKDSWLLENISR